MQGAGTGATANPSRLPIVSTLGLALASFYAAAGNYAFSNALSAEVLVYLAFGVAFVGIALGLWSRRRAAYLASVVASIVFLAVSSFVVSLFLGEPTAFPPFVFAVAAPPVSLLAIVSCVAGWREARLPKASALPETRQTRIPMLLAFAVVGFIIGGLFIGGLAAMTESNLIASSGTTADVTIVVGAGNQNNPLPYSPSPYTVKVGATVTWVNKDSSTHTVTSVGSSIFDSGNMPPGTSFKFTFTQAGTFQYYCTIHPWMKATIVVTSG